MAICIRTLTALFVTTVVLNAAPTTIIALSPNPTNATEETYALRIYNQPSGARSGTLLTKQPTVQIIDIKNRIVRTATNLVTVTSSHGRLSGTTTVAAVAGRATFTDLAISGLEGPDYTLTFTLTNGKSVLSQTFSMRPSRFTSGLRISALPDNIVSGTQISTPITVNGVDDAGNNMKDTANKFASITLSLSNGTLLGKTTIKQSYKGLITFPNLTFIGTGATTLIATSDNGLSGSIPLTIQQGCPEGRTCSVGDIGPGGGVVYYVDSAFFKSAGSACADQCKYLELAPKNWNVLGLCRASGAGPRCEILAPNMTAPTTQTTIGSGFRNTEAIISTVANTNPLNAAVLSRAYRGGNFADWYLPSKDELARFSDFRKQLSERAWQQSLFGSSCRTWSSSFGVVGKKLRGWSSKLGSPTFYLRPTGEASCVRPVRAF